MKAVAIILALAVISGCHARAVRQAEALPNLWEENVERFWTYVSEINSRADGLVENLKASQLSRELDTLITDTVAELTVYREDIQTKLGPYSQDTAALLGQDLQLLTTKLQTDMVDAKERSTQYLGELKTMMEQNADDVHNRANTYTRKLKKRLNKDTEVQENCIDLVGRIADRGAEYVSAREWMRICFELLELLKAHKKAIRRATVNTFGYIAKAIGPHDVLATLLNNLKVQERQNRVCTTVAIAIVAETCSPFTVLPALMNEYRVPELNVQNGVLKSLSFLFEYIGEMGKDYIYAVTPLLEDALMDRDLVHRQTASAVVQHMSLGVYGFGCEDSLNHLLNYVWPNVFETSPHVIQAVMGALEGLRVAIGPCRMLQYCLQGLFHPARKVRDVYWKIYNSIYIGSQDALIAHYPHVYNDEKNPYLRYELEYFL